MPAESHGLAGIEAAARLGSPSSGDWKGQTIGHRLDDPADHQMPRSQVLDDLTDRSTFSLAQGPPLIVADGPDERDHPIVRRPEPAREIESALTRNGLVRSSPLHVRSPGSWCAGVAERQSWTSPGRRRLGRSSQRRAKNLDGSAPKGLGDPPTNGLERARPLRVRARVGRVGRKRPLDVLDPVLLGVAVEVDRPPLGALTAAEPYVRGLAQG